MITTAKGALVEAHHLALCPRLRATMGRPITHPEARISIAHAIAECGGDFPEGAPDLQATMSLPKRYCFLDRLAPGANVLKRNGSRIDIAKHRLDLLPASPPVFACP